MANSQLPPIPQDQIGENFRWRDWFTKLDTFVNNLSAGSSTSGNYLTPADVGTMAYQNANNVTILGGNIDGTVIGQTTPERVNTDALRTVGLTGYLYGNDNTGDVTASTTIPYSGVTTLPYGSFYDTTSQHDGSTTIPYAMRLNSTAYSNGVSVVARTVSSTSSIATTTLTCTAIASGRFYPGMLLSGTGVTAGTYIYLQLSSTATAVATPTGSGGGAGVNTLTVSSATGLEARQFISGTNIPANTRIVDVSGTTVTLSANMTGAASGTYTVRPWGYQGTYSVSPSQTVASTTISGTTSSMITASAAGIYNIQFSAQFVNTDTSIHDIDVWFKKNDVTIADSNTQFSITSSHGSVSGKTVAALNFYVSLQAGDYVEIVWHTSDPAVYIEYIGPQVSPIRPAIPSVIVTANMVAAL